MSQPRTSRAVVQTGRHKFEIEELERIPIGPDDAMLKLELCGICGTDIEQYDGLMDDIGWTRGPTIPGHEPLGIIDEIGERAARRWGVQKGDRVAVEPLIPCEECEFCRNGERTKCSGWDRIYSYGLLGTDVEPMLFGGYSEYMYLHPNARMHKVPASIPVDIAVLFNPLAAGIRWGVVEPDLRFGDSILILGAGQRGLACLIAAKAAGASQIIVTDLARSSTKLDFALELGADAALVADEEDVVARVEELTGGRGVDCVVDVTPMATQPILDALEAVRNGGIVVLGGVKGGSRVSLDPDVLVRKSVTMRGVFTVDSQSYVHSIRMLQADAHPFAKLRTASYPLERAEEAILHLAGRGDGPPAINVAIAPGA